MKHIILSCAAVLASALGATAAPASPPAEVRIDLSSFAIAPRPIRLAAGQPVRLVFTNRSGGAHDFTARGLFAAASKVSGPVAGGTVDLAGHQSAVVELTPARGRYKVHCSHFGHSLMGMKGVVLVD